MKITVVGADSRLGEVLVPLLADHELQLVETATQDVRLESVAKEVLTGSDTLVDLAAAAIPASVAEADGGAGPIDYLPRCTYQLLVAAAEAGISRVVTCSTVDVMLGHDPRWRVNEAYRPRPPAEALPLAALLMETICTELALARGVPVLCLRLGHLCLEEEVADAPYDPLWLDLRDAARVICWATELDWSERHYRVVHVVHHSPRPRLDTFWRRHRSLPELERRFGSDRKPLEVAA